MYSQKGFSLVELLIAIAVLSLVIAGSLMAFQTLLQNTASHTLYTNVGQEADFVLRKMERELKQTGYFYPSPIYNTTPLFDKKHSIKVDENHIGPLAIEDTNTMGKSFTINNNPDNPPRPGDKFLVQGLDEIWTVESYSLNIISVEESIETEAEVGSQVKFINFARRIDICFDRSFENRVVISYNYNPDKNELNRAELPLEVEEDEDPESPTFGDDLVKDCNSETPDDWEPVIKGLTYFTIPTQDEILDKKNILIEMWLHTQGDNTKKFQTSVNLSNL